MKKSKKISLCLAMAVIVGLFVPLILLNSPLAADKLRQKALEQELRLEFERHTFSLISGFTFYNVSAIQEREPKWQLECTRVEAAPNHFFFWRGLPPFSVLEIENGQVISSVELTALSNLDGLASTVIGEIVFQKK